MNRSRACRIVATALLSLGTAGCSVLLDPTSCTQELRVQVTPRDTTVSVGNTFTPSVTLSSCGGKERLSDSFTYETTNPAAATVHPNTGRVTATGAGQADIRITGQRYGQVAQIRVTVSP